eukprot:TRINITY_DN107667_c0_g1_i1.p1 TRINITY_DN107667_c0_g1~~TRINITY_DN107667_c0_g1_i1.p1  ORF type:complete len:680 (+),score=116.57 TRINITY_DN107667_c0_g1_i1:47-2041(+)
MDVVWLKRDVRLHDHVPLATAATSSNPFVLLYLYEPDQLEHETVHGSHIAFVNEGLHDLEQRLRQLVDGLESERFITALAAEATCALEKLHSVRPIRRLLSHQETGHGASFKRDRRVAAWCQSHRVEWQQFPQSGVVRGLRADRTWHANWLVHLESYLQADSVDNPFEQEPRVLKERLLRPPPTSGTCRDGCTYLPSEVLPYAEGDGFPSASELGVPESRASDRPGRQKGGEGMALSILADFLHVRGERYSGGISSPNSGWTACSRLSPYIAWGHVSLRTIWQNVEGRKLEAKGAKWSRSLQAYLVRLQWRCNYCQRFEMRCWMEKRNMCSAWEHLRQGLTYMFGDQTILNGTNENERLEAFKQGRTGYPMVDACMRCLHETGWLNFRMRCMLVSFATFNLWLDWRCIANHMARCFLDYEPGIHYPQLQMQAGTTGCDLRCYSVVRQAKDQDPKGEFIRRYVPELRDLPGSSALEPWKHSSCTSAAKYPARIVDEAKTSKASKTVIAALQQWFQAEGVQGAKPPDLALLLAKQQKNAGDKAGRVHTTAGTSRSSDVGKMLREAPAKRQKTHADNEDEEEEDEQEAAEDAAAHGASDESTADTPKRHFGAFFAPKAAEASGSWACPRCTLINDGTSSLCGACEGPRPDTSPDELSSWRVVIDLDD